MDNAITLAGIKKALATFDTQHEIYLHSCNEPMSREKFDLISSKTDYLYKEVCNLDNLRALLAVVEAAMAIETYQDSLSGGIPSDREVEHLMRLHQTYLDALKVLK